MKMRWKHQNYIVVSGRRPREEKNGNCQLTVLLDAVSQHVPHVSVVPPEVNSLGRHTKGSGLKHQMGRISVWMDQRWEMKESWTELEIWKDSTYTAADTGR